MSETDPHDTESPDADDGQPNSPTDGETDDGRSVFRYLQWLAFGLLALLALVATLQTYLAATRTISIWISPDYRPIFQILFNLAVLALAGVGLSVLARRLR